MTLLSRSRHFLATTVALALVLGAGAATQAFVAPTTAPTTAGYTSGGSLISVMSGSLASIMGTSFSSGTHSLVAVTNKINQLPWTKSGSTSYFTGAATLGDTVVSGSLKLDVNGSIGATQYCDANGDNCVNPGSSSGTSPWTTSGTDVYRNAGNVGIGTATPAAKLEVVGGVKVGTDAASCTAAKAGTLRYSGGVIQYCNGTIWTP